MKKKKELIKKVDWTERPKRFVDPIVSKIVGRSDDDIYDIVDISMRVRITKEEQRNSFNCGFLSYVDKYFSRQA